MQKTSRSPSCGRARPQAPHCGGGRAILSLRYEEGFDTTGIAEILGIPPGKVKSRLHYARERLRKYLEG